MSIPTCSRSNAAANHGAELPFVFDVWDKALPQLPLDETDRAVTKLMHSCWTSFAKTGTPQCEGTPTWPRYDAESAPVMKLDTHPEVLTKFRQRQLDAQERAWQQNKSGSARRVEEAVQALAVELAR